MEIEVRQLDYELLLPAFELATQTFIEGSTLHRALGIGLEEYRNYLQPSFEAMVAEELSVVALDDQTGELLGCLIVTDFHRAIYDSSQVGEKFKPLTALTKALCNQYLQSHDLKAGQAILVDMGAVSGKAAGKGVYQMMRGTAQAIAKDKGYSHVVGELSSAATQHVIINKLGHEKVAELTFHDFKYGETNPFHSIKDPRSIILAEGML